MENKTNHDIHRPYNRSQEYTPQWTVPPKLSTTDRTGRMRSLTTCMEETQQFVEAPPRPFKKARYAWEIKNYEHTLRHMRLRMVEENRERHNKTEINEQENSSEENCKQIEKINQKARCSDDHQQVPLGKAERTLSVGAHQTAIKELSNQVTDTSNSNANMGHVKRSSPFPMHPDELSVTGNNPLVAAGMIMGPPAGTWCQPLHLQTIANLARVLADAQQPASVLSQWHARQLYRSVAENAVNCLIERVRHSQPEPQLVPTETLLSQIQSRFLFSDISVFPSEIPVLAREVPTSPRLGSNINAGERESVLVALNHNGLTLPEVSDYGLEPLDSSCATSDYDSSLSSEGSDIGYDTEGSDFEEENYLVNQIAQVKQVTNLPSTQAIFPSMPLFHGNHIQSPLIPAGQLNLVAHELKVGTEIRDRDMIGEIDSGTSDRFLLDQAVQMAIKQQGLGFQKA